MFDIREDKTVAKLHPNFHNYSFSKWEISDQVTKWVRPGDKRP